MGVEFSRVGCAPPSVVTNFISGEELQEEPSRLSSLLTTDVYVEVVYQGGRVQNYHPGRELNDHLYLPKNKPAPDGVVEFCSYKKAVRNLRLQSRVKPPTRVFINHQSTDPYNVLPVYMRFAVYSLLTRKSSVDAEAPE
jgi:hypothetical protein